MLYLDGGCVDALQKLKTLLEMTTEAEELASAVVKSERLRSLVAEIRHKAKAEHDRLRQDPQQMETRYQLCMIGILEEFDFRSCSRRQHLAHHANRRRLATIRELPVVATRLRTRNRCSFESPAIPGTARSSRSEFVAGAARLSC